MIKIDDLKWFHDFSISIVMVHLEEPPTRRGTMDKQKVGTSKLDLFTSQDLV